MTVIYSGTTSQTIMNNIGAFDKFFPEVDIFPLSYREQVNLLPSLIDKRIVTLSEIIILTFLKEVCDGRMRPDDIELYCDGKLIRIDSEGELIDRWPGGFFNIRAELLF